MKFQIKDLKKLLSSIQTKKVSEISIRSNTFNLIINKKSATSKKSQWHKSKNLISENSAPTKLAKTETLKVKTTTNDESGNYSTIVSPMVGTFYRAPAPNESAFVELYDKVQEKQTVCIIEAMKLMNEIEAEVNGKIVEILVKDGDIIDCGQALMRVKPIAE
uniref:acetyl-CoA carboxylase biotin carboxyl carrier protein n=1 Tax=Gloiopeltis furcata TaxID=42017 RepID=UPI0028D06A7C|nr:acetyl-CoA carboxylase biotin carboxyl carrier protein [Gloiopeltis furcata]WMP13915.1 acetyl-CoA carboxylase biotin carboxyl carrier protein [Gloiopeltis furcata]